MSDSTQTPTKILGNQTKLEPPIIGHLSSETVPVGHAFLAMKYWKAPESSRQVHVSTTTGQDAQSQSSPSQQRLAISATQRDGPCGAFVPDNETLESANVTRTRLRAQSDRREAKICLSRSAGQPREMNQKKIHRITSGELLRIIQRHRKFQSSRIIRHVPKMQHASAKTHARNRFEARPEARDSGVCV